MCLSAGVRGVHEVFEQGHGREHAHSRDMLESLDRERDRHSHQVAAYISAPPHVAIVGGGPAGIAACKALTCRGISCLLFEAQQQLGGMWVTAYPGAATQVGTACLNGVQPQI